MKGDTTLYDSAALPHPAVRELIALARYRDLVAQLVRRNITVRYKRSLLGVAWSMLGPTLMMVMLSVVFTRVFRPTAPAYPLYLLPGLLLWTFFSQTTLMITAEVIGGVELWKRIYTPRAAFAVATTTTGLVHLALALVPLLLLMMVYGAPLSMALLTVPYVVVCTALFALGVGLALASVAGYFADVADLYSVILAAWMYFTPIIYPRAILPEQYRWIWQLNPLAHLVESFRMPFYQHAVPPPGLLLLDGAIGLLTFAAGWWLFTRTADDLARRG